MTADQRGTAAPLHEDTLPRSEAALCINLSACKHVIKPHLFHVYPAFKKTSRNFLYETKNVCLIRIHSSLLFVFILFLSNHLALHIASILKKACPCLLTEVFIYLLCNVCRSVRPYVSNACIYISKFKDKSCKI